MKRWKIYLIILTICGLYLSINRSGPLCALEQSPPEDMNITLLCFVALDSPYTDQAIKGLTDFRQNHPEVETGGILIASAKEIKNLMPERDENRQIVSRNPRGWGKILTLAKNWGQIRIPKPGETHRQILAREMEKGEQHFKTSLPLYIDFRLEYVETYNINVVPTFVFRNKKNDQVYKIAGQPNLEQIYKQYLASMEKVSRPK